MWMREDQIYILYRDARYPSKEIKILAELNGCSADTIRLILHRQGADIPLRVLQKSDIVTAEQLRRARELRHDGFTYKRIAEATGIPLRSVRYYLNKFKKEKSNDNKNIP